MNYICSVLNVVDRQFVYRILNFRRISIFILNQNAYALRLILGHRDNIDAFIRRSIVFANAEQQ